jgi:hypothetical protein
MAARESFVATKEGIELVDARRIQRGWPRKSTAFAQRAMVGITTLGRFWSRKRRLDRDSIIGIFAAVGIQNWQDYVESNEAVGSLATDLAGDLASDLATDLATNLANEPANDLALPRLPDNLPNYAPFFGRLAELEQVEQYVLPHAAELQPDGLPKRYQVINFWGLGGIGKSALAVRLARQLSSEFEGVIWRSMQPPLGLNEFLTDLLSELTDSLPEPAQSETFNSRLLIDLLTEQLQLRRILLICDSWEVFLGGGSAGIYQESFQDYRRLLSHLWQHPHQSAVLVISRERLADVSLLGASVISYPIRALDSEAAFQLLRHKGLKRFNPEDGAKLVQACGGNPLALQLSASRIRDHFNGNIADFLEQEPGLIDKSMRFILDQQTRSLSPLELQILIALAQDAEPVDRNALAARLSAPCSTTDLLNGLSSLEKRSLVERITDLDATLYGLQPLVRAYTQQYLS